MGDVANLQTSFLGGEWSPNAQGRAEHPNYKTAMAVSFNGYPVEEGAWTRRPGFFHAATTYNGLAGRTLPFLLSDVIPFEIELTAENLRAFAGKDLVHTPDEVALSSVAALSGGISQSPTNLAVSFQTTGPNQIIVLFIQWAGGGTQVSSITSLNGLTYTRRYRDVSVGQDSSIPQFETWVAKAPNPISETVTANLDFTSNVSAIMAAVFTQGGDNYPAFDGNASFPAGGYSAGGSAVTALTVSSNASSGLMYGYSYGNQIGNTAGGDVQLSSLWLTQANYDRLNLSYSIWDTVGVQAFASQLANTSVTVIPSAPTSGLHNRLGIDCLVPSTVGKTVTLASTASVFTFSGNGDWSSITTYDVGDVVVSTVDNNYYYANASSLNKEPSANAGANGPWQRWWSDGDQVEFVDINTATNPVTDGAQLRNRQLVVTFYSATQFTLTDPIDGTPVQNVAWTSGDTATIARVMRLTTPYAAPDIPTVRGVPAASVGPNQSDVMMLLHADYAPEAVYVPEDLPTPPTDTPFAIQPAVFSDGPYLDPIPGAVLSAATVGPQVVLTLSYQAWSASNSYTQGTYVEYSGQTYVLLALTSVGDTPSTSPTVWKPVTAGGAVNNGQGFISSDIGRCIRLWSEPPSWISDASLGIEGAWGGLSQVTLGYPGNGDPSTQYYQNASGTWGVGIPGSNYTWILTAGINIAAWVWGRITGVNSATQIQVTLMSATTNTTGTTAAELLYDAADQVPYSNAAGLDGQQHTISLPVVGYAPANINIWQLGVYGETNGYPTVGAYFEGRLWLGGAVRNRFDASNSNQFFNMAPSAADGTVGDGNAITVYADDVGNDQFQWLQPIGERLIAGTKTGCWQVYASALNDPITPNDTQAHKIVRIGTAIVPPVSTPLTAVFVEPYGRQMYELYPDVFTQRITAPNLNVFSKHMTAPGILEMAYQNEAAPIIWSRLGDGTFTGTTYRRVSLFAQEDPKFVGSHRHAHGGNYTVESLCVVPTPDFKTDSLNVVANDGLQTLLGPSDGVRHVEFMMPQQEPAAQQATTSQLATILAAADHLDAATIPPLYLADSGGVNFYGLYHFANQSVRVMIGGLDCGTFTVDKYVGTIYVPFQSDPGHFFTSAFWTALVSAPNTTWGSLGTLPVLIGLAYTSQGQKVRAVEAQDVADPSGPGIGKTRRSHMFAMLLSAAVVSSLYVGTLFTKLRPVTFKQKDGNTSYLTNTLFSGVHWGTLDDDYSFDSQLCWQITSPLPLTIAAAGNFQHTQPR